MPGLQAEASARLAALPARRAPSRGVAAGLAGALRPAPRPAAGGGRACVAGVPALRPARARLRPALVRPVPKERTGRLLLPQPQLLPLLREEEAVALGRVGERRSRGRSRPPPRRPDHPAPAASVVPASPRAVKGERAISKELVARLVAWRHPGFSAHLGARIAAEDKQRLEDTAAYLVRNPLSLKKLVYLDGQKAVLYCSKLNPFPGAKLRGDAPARMAGQDERPHSRPRPAPHTVLRRVRRSSAPAAASA